MIGIDLSVCVVTVAFCNFNTSGLAELLHFAIHNHLKVSRPIIVD
jgi:hypothetical protein